MLENIQNKIGNGSLVHHYLLTTIFFISALIVTALAGHLIEDVTNSKPIYNVIYWIGFGFFTLFTNRLYLKFKIKYKYISIALIIGLFLIPYFVYYITVPEQKISAEAAALQQATTYCSIGNNHLQRGDLAKAEEMFRASLKIYESLGRKDKIANQYHNLGLSCWRQGLIDMAEEMHRKSLALNKELNRTDMLTLNYINLSLVYEKRGDLDAEEEMHRLGLGAFESSDRVTDEGKAQFLYHLGNIYLKRNNFTEAEKFYKNAIRLVEPTGNKKKLAMLYRDISDVYAQKGDSEKAKESLQKYLDLNSSDEKSDGKD
jgi:tetratricopeptide (TPR) repeat protein